MSQVSIIFGGLGSGKTMFATKRMRDSRMAGRKQFATYQTEWSAPLLSLAHAWCPEFAGSDFTIDESASMFNSRDFKDLDVLAFSAVSHARHQDVRIYFIVQSPSMLDIQFRRLAGTYIRVQRHGPSGEAARSGKRLGFFERPWWFTASYFDQRDFIDGTLNPNARPWRKHRFRFDSRLAASYDSFNLLPPANLTLEYAALRAGAAAAAALPEWVFVNGKAVPQRIPDLDVWWPVAESEVRSKHRRANEEDARRLRNDYLRSIGYFDAATAPDHAILPWPRPVERKVVAIDVRIVAARVLADEPGAVELLVSDGGEDEWLVIPAVACDIPLNELPGCRLRCHLSVYQHEGRELQAVALDYPIIVEPPSGGAVTRKAKRG